MSFKDAIDSRAALPSDFTYETIRFQTHTGRSIRVSDRGHDKKYGYRHGVETPIGDIEEKLWCEVMKELIIKNGEKELFDKLAEWYKDDPIGGKTKFEQEFYTLQCFSYRIFDNTAWVDYIPFNAKHRPEILATRTTDFVLPLGTRTSRVIFHESPAHNTELSYVGQVRIDFGEDGLEFHHLWDVQEDDGQSEMSCKEDLLSVVAELRPLVLRDLHSIRKAIQESRGDGSDSWVDNFGYIVDTDHNRYYLTCPPGEGKYQTTLACFQKNVACSLPANSQGAPGK